MTNPPAIEMTPTARKWVAFVRAHGRPCFVDWPDEIIVAWIRFHIAQRTIIITRTNDVINALLIVWQCRRENLEKHWQPDDPSGDCLYLSHAISTDPAGTATAMGWLNQRWPKWRQLNIFWRRGARGLVPVQPGHIFKLYSLAQRRVMKGKQLCPKPVDLKSISS